MNVKAGRAVGALLRWREFNESQASAHFGHCANETQRTKAQTQADEAAVEAIQRQRTELLEGALDPVVLQLAANIEAVAWQSLETSQERQASAQKLQDTALAAYVATRADTRVAEARHGRIALVEKDREEKVMFDWMADLHMQTGRHRHD